MAAGSRGLRQGEQPHCAGSPSSLMRASRIVLAAPVPFSMAAIHAVKLVACIRALSDRDVMHAGVQGSARRCTGKL